MVGDDFIEYNKLYCMDNLEFLKSIDSNSIDLIYSDVLYNTKSNFNDFKDNLGSIKDVVNWYKPRLIEMYRVLKDTGSIYLQMDYRIVHYLKVLMDEVFGEENFKNHIIWKKRTGTLKAKSHKLAIFNDDILFYTKSDTYTFNPIYKEHEERYVKRFKYDDGDGNGRYRWSPLKTYSEDKLKQLDSEGRLRWGENASQPEFKYYLKDTNGKSLDNVWDDIFMINPQSKERIGYDTQKPKKLLQRIIELSSNEGDVVADFFMGSGTTVEVAKEMGRNYIGCDINPRALEITEERINITT